MVGEVVPKDSFNERFDEYCQSLTELSPITARLTKRVVQRATAMTDAESRTVPDRRATPPARVRAAGTATSSWFCGAARILFAHIHQGGNRASVRAICY